MLRKVPKPIIYVTIWITIMAEKSIGGTDFSFSPLDANFLRNKQKT